MMKTKNSYGFTTPDQYFDLLNQQLKSAARKQVANSGYDVPTGYFHLLNQRLKQLPHHSNKSIGKLRFKTAAFMLVALTGLLGAFFFNNNHSTHNAVNDFGFEDADIILTDYDIIEYSETFIPGLESSQDSIQFQFLDQLFIMYEI